MVQVRMLLPVLQRCLPLPPLLACPMVGANTAPTRARCTTHTPTGAPAGRGPPPRVLSVKSSG